MKKNYIIILLLIIPTIFLLATTYHTITIDGTNDFASDEDVAGTSVSTYYITWDSNNIYLGANNDNIDDNSSTKWILFYIDSDPQLTPTNGTGATTGVQYNTQQPGLPFTANYHFRWKNDGSYTNLQQYSGGSWIDGTQTGISVSRSGTFVEFKIPRSNIGNPSQIHIAGTMINEQGGSESTYYMTPATNNSDGYDKDYQSFFGFNLASGVSPDNTSLINQPLPVELVSFSALQKGKEVKLNWQTATEVTNYGFEVERASYLTLPVQGWAKIGFVNGHGNSNSPKSYSFVDKNVLNGSYNYRLKQIDTDGKYEYSPTVEVTVDNMPTQFELSQNYPNPFNPSTVISYALPSKEFVQLKVFNILGNEIATLVNEVQEAGNYKVEFNPVISIQQPVSGIYFYRLEAGSFVDSRKMTLVK